MKMQKKMKVKKVLDNQKLKNYFFKK